MKIKFEVDVDPPMGFAIESKFLMDPIPVGIKTYVPSDLFAGKMHALLCRLWNERIKGRDWYDKNLISKKSYFEIGFIFKF